MKGLLQRLERYWEYAVQSAEVGALPFTVEAMMDDSYDVAMDRRHALGHC